MKKVFNPSYDEISAQIDKFITEFDALGDQLGLVDRNTIKVFDLNGMKINIKSFKVPNIFNQIAYKFFRSGKAQRSFEYANTLTHLGIGTPSPIAYYEFPSNVFFKESYYISEQIDYDLTFRELNRDPDYPDHEAIIRAFTRFTFNLHEKKVQFLDHSTGNTLMKKKRDGYQFFLVDLNRMNFKQLSLTERIRNFRRLTIHRSHVEIMSDEYAKCGNIKYEDIFPLMWRSTQEFQEKYHRRRRIKKALKFWK